MGQISTLIENFIATSNVANPSTPYSPQDIAALEQRARQAQKNFYTILRQIGINTDAIAAGIGGGTNYQPLIDELEQDVTDLETDVSGINSQLVTLFADIVSINAQLAAISTSGATGSVDYIYDLTGTADGTNRTFTTRLTFQAGTTNVQYNGQGMTRGGSYDYIEVGNNQIQFNFTPKAGSTVTVRYSH